MPEDHRPPIVGRSAEIGMLHERLAAVERGPLQAVLIEGEAGSGKTRLLDAFCEQASRRGFALLRGASEELASDRPLGTFVEALDRLPSAPGRERLAAILAPRAPDWEPAEARFQALEEVLTLIELMARAAPVAVVLDDLHWADSLTLLAVVTIAARLADRPIALVGAARPTPRAPELARTFDRLIEQGGAHMLLRALDEEEIEAIATHELGAPPGPVLREALRGTGGNPLFAIELTRALREEGTLEEQGGIVDARRPSLPPSLQLTILRRLAPLADETLRALRAASALGSSFALADLATVLDRSPIDLVPLLDEPIRAGFLTDENGRFAFRHQMIRDAVYLDLPAASRAGLHLGAARRLAAAGAPADVVATHFAAGASPGDSEAIDWLIRAGTEAMAKDPGVSGNLLQRALELADPTDERRPWASSFLVLALAWSGRVMEAEIVAREELAGGSDPGSAAFVRLALGRAFALHGRLSDALVELNAAEPALSGEPHSELLSGIALIHALAGDTASALDAARVVQTEGGQAGAASAVAGARMAEAVGKTLRGAVQDGANLAERAAEDIRAARGRGRFATVALVGLCMERADRTAEAERMLVPVLPEAERSGGPSETAAIHAVLGLLRFELGRWDEAEIDIAAAASLSEEMGVPLYAASPWPQVALIRMAVYRGDLASAQAILEQATPAEGGPAIGLDAWHWAHALLEDARGNGPAALGLLRRAWDLDISKGLVSELRAYASDLARIAVRQGDAALAEDVASMMERTSQLIGTHGVSGTALRCRGLAVADPDALLRAVEELRHTPRPLDLAYALEDAGNAIGRAGERDRAGALLRESAGILEGLRASRESARVEAGLRALGIRRGARTARRRARTGWESLTRTEEQVARLAAEGLTNREIGDRLYVSPRTVGTHISHVLTKLELRSRVALAAEIARRSE